MSEPLWEKLRGVLGLERASLLSGAFGDLSGIAEQKHDLLARFAPGSVGLIELHDDLQRNQALLRSAIEGLREAAQRMAELRETRDGFRAYDSYGQRATVTSIPPRMERKA